MIDLSGLPDKSDGLDLSGLPDSNANALKSAYRNAPDASEAYAKSRSMAEMTGLPAEVVQRNPQSAEQMAAEPDWVSLEVDAPRLTQALSRDVELFKLAKDDVNQLGDLERIIRGIPRKESSSGFSAMNVLRGAGERTTDLIGNVAGFVATAGANVEKSAQLGGFVWENGAILPAYKSGAEFATWIAENPGGSILRNVQESLTAISLGYKPGTTWEDVKQSEGALNVAAKLASFGLETGLVSLPDMVAAVANAPAYFTSRTEEIAQDRAKNDGRESPTENDVAVAAGTAFIVAAMEKFGAERVFSAFIRGGSAPSKILKAAVGEGGTEFIQEQIEYAGESVGTEVGFDVGQSFERGLQGIVGGVTTGGAIAAVGATASAGRDAAVSGDAKELIARISRVEVAANKAQQSKEALDKAVDLASQTKLKTHSPEALASVMEEMLGDEAESIHLSAEAAQTFFQANPEALEIVQQKLPEVAASYVEAATTGGDVVIPTKDYITYFSEYHQALASKVRVGGGMSLEEAEQWKQQAGDEFKMEADAILQARAEDDAFQASADEVQQSIREQIEATGRFTPDVADKYAALHRAFAVTMADRLGITPSEVYSRYGLRIRVPASSAESAPLLPEEAAAGGTFDQSAYHGTPHTFDRFSLSAIGTGEGAQAYGWGLYFAGNRAVAEYYRKALSNPGGNGWTTAGDYDPTAGEGRGNLYQVDIPDDNELLDWDRPLSKQPAGVQEKLTKLADQYGYSYDEASTGGEFYRALTMDANADGLTGDRRDAQQASAELLNSVGIPGLRYLDEGSRNVGDAIYRIVSKADGFTSVSFDSMADADKQLQGYLRSMPDAKIEEIAVNRSHNYVIWDEGRVTVEAVNDELRQAREFYQPRHSQPDYAREARGFISFPENVQSAPSVITLLENADLSTFLHETGHFFFEVMADMASDPNAPDQIKKDMQTLLDWYGVENLEAWRKVPMQKRREGHEKFAGGFESYLLEGKAPSLELQPLFSRFRAWLMKVYESLRGLDVQLTPEVRQVMDRMLATDEQIRLSEAALSYRPLFESAEEAGMTGAEWDEYLAGDPKARQEAVEELETRSLKDMRWLSNAKSKALKELQAEAKDKRKAVAAEVTQEVQSHPVYQAIRFLKKGEVTTPDGEEIKAEEGYKLNNEALQEMYPPGALVTVDLKKLSGMVSEDGLPPDEIAGIFGFSSGDHLVQAIIEAKPIGEVIESLTDQRMLERYGDLVDPKAMEAAAESAVHNEARAKFVATELRALARRTGSRAVLVKAAKDYAAQKTAAKKVKDAIKPGQYSLAEARAAKAAETALRKGNPEQAATHKRAQLLNLYMFRAATDAKSEVEKTISYLRKFDREGTRKNLDQEYLDQIDRLLEAFDFRKVTGKALAKRASLKEWIEAQQAMGLDPVIDDALLGDLQKRHFSEVTLEELRGLKDTIKNIEHLGRLKKKLLTIQAKKELEELATQAEASIRSSKVAKEMDIETRLPKDRAAQAVSSFFASHRKLASYMRQMDGFKDGGVMWELFTRPLNEASNKEAVMREEATKRLSELFARYTAKDMRAMYRKVYIPSIGRSLSKQARLVIALNWGNEDNRQRIMDGYNWTEVQVQAILNTLEEKDWQFVQDTWDYLNEYWPAISEKEKRVTGIAPEKVGPSPVQTKFGTFRGGYYPIKYDDRQSPRAFADAAKEAAKQALQGAFTRATTRRGHTKSRVEGVKRPVRLDFGVAFEHVEQVIHDLAFHEYLIDTNRLLGHEKIQSAIVETYGHEVYKQIKGTIDDVAAGDVPAQTAFQGAINWIRAGSSIAAMGWNIGTAMLQPLGLSQSMVRIGPKWVAKGLSRWARDAASMENTAAWINERSDFMRLRAKTMQREINEIRNKVEDQSARKKILGPAEDSYFWLISKAQMVADVPTWLGQYEKAMANGETEDKAIALADQAVLDSQGGGQVKDLAQIQRGGPLMKLWTNFYSYFNVTYNLTAESIRRTKFKDPASVGRLAVDMLLLYTAPAVLGWLLRGALIKGECDGGSDLECVAEKLTREQASYLMGTMVGLREMSGAVQGFYGYEGPGGARGFAAAAKLIKQVEQGEVDEALIKSLNATAGVFFHYPAGQVQRTAEGIAALSEGETSNPLAILTGAPKQ